MRTDNYFVDTSPAAAYRLLKPMHHHGVGPMTRTVVQSGGVSVQLGSVLEFNCVTEGCGHAIKFAILDVKDGQYLTCAGCGQWYSFNKELVAALAKFDKLCRAIHEAEGILGDTNVAVHVAGHEVKIPFRLLLTRLNTSLTIRIPQEINGKTVEHPIDIQFRLQPLTDIE